VVASLYYWSAAPNQGWFSIINRSTSRVVQGSAIGPLLFLSFINELAEILHNCGVTVKLFADVVKVYVEIVGNYIAQH